ncbi:MAG: saccharopine dehydrogenase NADP-binding domain-containing protein, partial [Candidatus Woesearchaeota archaeon]
MKILIIGAGAVASVLSKCLSREKSVKSITCASKDRKQAKEFINCDKKTKLVQADARNTRQIAGLAKGHDLVINASLPFFNKTIMEAALQAGCNYQDLCSNLSDLKTVEQLKYHKKFQQKKLTGIINTGVAPGITNLLAREAADRLDQVTDINFRIVEEQKSSELVFAWSPEVTLDELTSSPLSYRKGRFRLLKPFADPEEYKFPEFGKRHVVNIYGDEVATIPYYIKTDNVSFKSCGTDIEFSKALYRLGLFEKKPVSVHGKKIVPLKFFMKIAPKTPTPKKMMQLIREGIVENASFCLAVEVSGLENSRRIRITNTAIFPDLKRISKIFPGATYISYPTGVAAAAFAKAIPKIKDYGVYPPEAIDRHIRKEILIQIESCGVVI